MSMHKEEDKKSSDSKRFLEFYLGKESYAVELLKVIEVLTLPEMTPIPKAPGHVCGLMNLRGMVLTVIDLRKKLGITPSEDHSQMAVIIFDLNERMVGVVVDSIQKVMNVSTGSILPMPESETHTEHLLGILKQDNKLTMWLDPVALLEKSVSAAA